MKDKLIDAVIRNRDKLFYVNLNEKNEYLGWTYNFNIIMPNEEHMSLDLSKEDDLFLLFVLASCSSKTGPWENAAFFTAYLKLFKKDKFELWLDKNFLFNEIARSKESARDIVNLCNGVIPRKQVNFRSDYYSSVMILAKNWKEIKEKLEISNKENNYSIFINYMSQLDGIGRGRNKMKIKIPLILRELRCQKIYNNIPGELCCSLDDRGKVPLRQLGIKVPNINSVDTLLEASKVIYDNFGDLYDIPLFAYEDVRDDLIKQENTKNE